MFGQKYPNFPFEKQLKKKGKYINHDLIYVNMLFYFSFSLSSSYRPKTEAPLPQRVSQTNIVAKQLKAFGLGPIYLDLWMCELL